MRHCGFGRSTTRPTMTVPAAMARPMNVWMSNKSLVSRPSSSPCSACPLQHKQSASNQFSAVTASNIFYTAGSERKGASATGHRRAAGERGQLAPIDLLRSQLCAPLIKRGNEPPRRRSHANHARVMGGGREQARLPSKILACRRRWHRCPTTAGSCAGS